MAEAVKNSAPDIAACRADFPALNRPDSPAYLDTAASAQKPRVVIDAMAQLMEGHYANIHRGLYAYSQKTTESFEAARARVAVFVGAPDPREIIFTRNATEAINLVAQSWAGTFLEDGDEIILTEMEHHANIVPWDLLRRKKNIVIRTIPVRDDGTLDLERFERMLTQKTKMVCLAHVSNALGTVNPVHDVIAIARDFYPDMKILIDGSQAVVHGAVDLAFMGADFYVFTGHKLYGPTGIGVLWGRYALLNEMPPYQGGGDMIDHVAFDYVTFKDAPARFEAGTPAIIEAIGLAAAIAYLETIGMETIAAHEADLLAYGMARLGDIEGLHFYGLAENKAGIISFTADWGHPSDIGMILDQCGVAVRTGHHCCQPLMARYGIDATVRASLGLYSDKGDIDALAQGLEKAQRMLKG